MNKKLFMMFFGCALLLTSCYDDFVVKYYDFTGVYFNKTLLTRTAVYDEGLYIKAGIHLSGDLVLDNRHTAQFEVDNSLLDGTSYVALPDDYYTIVDDEFVIEKEYSVGYITIEFDEEKFKNDDVLLSNTASGSYALALQLTDTSADSILVNLSYQVIPVKYVNTFEGYYYQTATISADGYDDVIRGDSYDYIVSPVHELTTLSPTKSLVSGLGENLSDNYILEVNADNSVTLSAVEGSGITIANAGSCTWDPTTRYLDLNYTFSRDSEGITYTVSETLIFRNRVRDGYSEWRWDGFDGN